MSRTKPRCTHAELLRAQKVADAAARPRSVKVDPDGTIWIVPAGESDHPVKQPKIEPKRVIVL